VGKYQVHRKDSNHDEIVNGLIAYGATVEPLGRPVDIAVGYEGRNYMLEIKPPKGAVRASQRAFMARWRGQVDVVRSLAEALAVIGVQP
jgi:hypothetical protein